MDQQEQNRVNRVVQALTNQRNGALNEVANMAAALAERDEIIAQLQRALAELQANRAPVIISPDGGAVPDGVGGGLKENTLNISST